LAEPCEPFSEPTKRLTQERDGCKDQVLINAQTGHVSWRAVTSDNRISQHPSGDPFRRICQAGFPIIRTSRRGTALAGKAGGLLYGGALIAVARGVAGGEDEPLVAIEFAEEGMLHEIVAQLLGIGRGGGEFDGVPAGGVEFV
jgi:hypothetical protein